MKKLAFCFLTYDKLNRSDIWKMFFNNISNNKYNIYINNKEKFNDSFNEFCINNRYTDTKWGDISLVKATLRLFEKAYQDDNDNEYFILLSNSCIPIQRFNKIYSYLNNVNKSIIYFEQINNKNILKRCDKMNDKTFFDQFVKQSQWMILKRDVVKFFLDNKYFDIFGNEIFAPDEHYFVNICLKYNLPFDNKQLIYVNWNNPSDNPRYRLFPKTYDSINLSELIELQKDNYFMRKISDDCKLPINFIKYININLINVINKWIGTDNVFLLINSIKLDDIISIKGVFNFMNNINYRILKEEDINTLQNKKIVMFGNFNSNNFIFNINMLQQNNQVFILPHSNFNFIMMKKLSSNVTIVAREYKTYNLYKKYATNINCLYIHYDMGFYFNYKDFLFYNKTGNENLDYFITDEKYNNINDDINMLIQKINNFQTVTTNSLSIILLCIFFKINCNIKDNKTINKSLHDYILKYSNIKLI